MGRSRQANPDGPADQNQGQHKQHPAVDKKEIKAKKEESSKQVEETKKSRKKGD